MSHVWESYVLGGVDRPQILFLGDDLIENGNFEDGVSEWSGSSVTFERVVDSDTFYGDYCMKITQTAPSAYHHVKVDGGITLAESADGKTFLIGFAAKTDESVRRKFRIVITDDNGTSTEYQEYYREVGPEWEQFSIVHEMSVQSLNSAINLHFCPVHSQEYPHVGQTLKLDHIQVFEVLNQYELPDPQAYSQSFDKIIEKTNELINGDLIEYRKGWRYSCKLVYGFMNALQEKVRTEISNATSMAIIPHKDSQFFQRVLWDKKYDRRYWKNRYLGYEGSIVLKGVELINKQPTDIVGIGGYGIDEWGYGIS